MADLPGRAPVPLRVVLPEEAGPDDRLRELLEQLRAEAGQADRDGDDSAAADLRRAAVALACRYGALTREALPGPDPTPVRATCFGDFRLCAGGRPLTLSGLRPRARSALRLLALQAGRPVHREVLLAALWPEADPLSASRSMLTTLSSVRAVLGETGATRALTREGAAYRLDATAVVTDLALADAALHAAKQLRADRPAEADAAYERALDLYAGELLVEEGPADWVVEPREEWRTRMAAAAYEQAVLRYSAGRPAAAVAAARRGLAVDRNSDPLWRVLLAALRADDDAAAAERAEAEYGQVLASLT